MTSWSAVSNAAAVITPDERIKRWGLFSSSEHSSQMASALTLVFFKRAHCFYLMRTHVTHTLSHTFLFHSYVSRARTLHASAFSPLGFSCGVCQLATMGFFTRMMMFIDTLQSFPLTFYYSYSVTHCFQFYVGYMWKKIRFWVPKKMIKTYQTNSTDFWARLGNLRRKRTPRKKIQLLARTRPRYLEKVLTDLAPVVQTVDNAIHRINHYLLDIAIGFAITYPVDSDLSGR